MGNFTFSLPGVNANTGTEINSSLYSKTKDADLTYTGSDPTVWDRINAERLRRGLPGLASLGYPRPPEETPAPAAPTTAGGGASTFEVKGPPGMTYEQAKAIFDKQVNTGALVGFKSGDTLSAATQAADGLASAQAQLSQGLTGVPGLNGAPGLNVGTFASALSAGGVDLKTGRIASVDSAFASGGLSAAGGALGTSINSAAFTLGGAGGALNGSLSSISAGLSGAVGPAVSSVTGELTRASGQIGPVATQAISTINKSIAGTAVTSPIDVANFAKQTPALTSIAGMSQPEVTAVLAQAKNLVGQGPEVLSNTKGVGEFGLNVSQLEKAGVLKPGIAALAAKAGATISSVLKSPASYTGKDGIKDVSSLLSNVPKQAEIQQTLMAQGLNDLKAVGIPVDKLSAQGVAGVALSAAKSVPDTENLLKNLPVPPEAKAAFDTAVRDGAFAVNLADTKVPDVYKAVDTPVPAADTVNRATVDAATTRVIGNDKIPEPNYGPSTKDSLSDDAFIDQFAVLYANVLNNYINPTGRTYQTVENTISALDNQQTITRAQWENVNNQFQTAFNKYNEQAPAKIAELNSFVESGTARQQRILSDEKSGIKKLQNLIQYLLKTSAEIKEQLRLLAGKIQG
jgi:hypothetical protein